MSDPIPTDDERVLAERLRREALDERPAFSASLHARLCAAVRQAAASPAPSARRPAARRPALYWAVAAATAACVLAAAVIAWKETARPDGGTVEVAAPSPQPSVPVSAPRPTSIAARAEELAPVGELTHGVSAAVPALVDSTIEARKWAYLDHDARLGVQMLVDRLPWQFASAAPASQPP